MNPTEIQLDVLKQLIKVGGTGNVMELLDIDNSEFQKGFDVVNDMQNLDYIKLLYLNFNKNQLVAEITLLGRTKSTLY